MKIKLCECGCEQIVKEGNRFIVGHNGRLKENINRMRQVNLGRKPSEETKIKMSKAQLGKKHSEESKMKMSKANLGKKFSEEHKRKIGLASLGRIPSEETRMKLSKVHLGKKHLHSEETKRKISLANSGKKHLHSEETKRKIGIGNKNKKRSTEQVLFLSKRTTKMWQDPEYRQKLIEAHKGIIPTKESLLKMVKTKRERGTDKKSKETRNRMSQAQTKSYLSGKMKKSSRGNNGFYFSKKNNKNIWYRSNYELVAYGILEQLSKVKSYEIEPFSIQYEWQNSTHRTIPDILVTYTDGSKELIEVKPEYKFTIKKEVRKMRTMKDYAKNNNMLFSVWTEKELNLP